MLEVGTGSGYQAAVLAELVMHVYSIERIAELAVRARRLLDGLGYQNVSIKVFNGTLGWKEESPFDRIIVSAAAPEPPTMMARPWHCGPLDRRTDMVIHAQGRSLQSQHQTRVDVISRCRKI